jgi:hypothetical protein
MWPIYIMSYTRPNVADTVKAIMARCFVHETSSSMYFYLRAIRSLALPRFLMQCILDMIQITHTSKHNRDLSLLIRNSPGKLHLIHEFESTPVARHQQPQKTQCGRPDTANRIHGQGILLYSVWHSSSRDHLNRAKPSRGQHTNRVSTRHPSSITSSTMSV